MTREDHDPVAQERFPARLADALEAQRSARDRPRVGRVTGAGRPVGEAREIEAMAADAERDGVTAAPDGPEAERARVREVRAVDEQDSVRPPGIDEPAADAANAAATSPTARPTVATANVRPLHVMRFIIPPSAVAAGTCPCRPAPERHPTRPRRRLPRRPTGSRPPRHAPPPA